VTALLRSSYSYCRVHPPTLSQYNTYLYDAKLTLNQTKPVKKGYIVLLDLHLQLLNSDPFRHMSIYTVPTKLNHDMTWQHSNILISIRLRIALFRFGRKSRRTSFKTLVCLQRQPPLAQDNGKKHTCRSRMTAGSSGKTDFLLM
jgi:hypothetical protein